MENKQEILQARRLSKKKELEIEYKHTKDAYTDALINDDFTLIELLSKKGIEIWEKLSRINFQLNATSP